MPLSLFVKLISFLYLIPSASLSSISASFHVALLYVSLHLLAPKGHILCFECGPIFFCAVSAFFFDHPGSPLHFLPPDFWRMGGTAETREAPNYVPALGSAWRLSRFPTPSARRSGALRINFIPSFTQLLFTTPTKDCVDVSMKYIKKKKFPPQRLGGSCADCGKLNCKQYETHEDVSGIITRLIAAKLS